MIRTAVAHLRAQWMGALALFLVIAGGTAYAADTIGSSDIINESILSEDIKLNNVKTPDLAAGSVQTGKIANNQVFSEDVRDRSLPGGGLTGADIAPNSLTGTAHIIDGSIGSSDIEDGSMGHDQVQGLHGEDIGEQFVTFNASMPAVGARTCAVGLVSGLPTDARDHLVLTESSATALPNIMHLALFRQTVDGTMYIRRCNLSDTPAPAANHTFNLLVIDAQ